MLLARLRWSAFGLRGRIVGAVLVTTTISLGAAALVLLPRLETVLKNAAESTLKAGVGKRAVSELQQLARFDYWVIPDCVLKTGPVAQSAMHEANQLVQLLGRISNTMGTSNVTLVGDIDAQGNGRVIQPVCGPTSSSPGYPGDVTTAFREGRPVYPLSTSGASVVQVAIPLNIYYKHSDAVLAVRSSIQGIDEAVSAVRQAFEIGALVGLVLTILIAIPLAGTLVSRLQRLRQAALQLAMGGSISAFPADRARDEVGDLSRSFSIMQRRLRQQEEARRAFVATASHELRTPLASLEGMLELLADDLQGEHPDLEDAAGLLDRSRVQSRRLARLAADLLDLSRIDADVTLRSEPIELGELCRAVAAEFEVPSAARGVSVALDDDDRPTWALADPGSVARILRILLDNALRVAPRGSEVRVTVRSDPDPTLTVSDQGPGVAQEERALIFERFKRGRETGGEAGFGLGLAIGRELAQRMGGSLVLAETRGPGATFTLRLQPTGAPSSDPMASAAGV